MYSLLDIHGPPLTARPADGAFPSSIMESSHSPSLRDGRVAIVHDWCPAFRGGERVLAQLCRLFPGAEVFTLFDFLRSDIKEEFSSRVIFHTSRAPRAELMLNSRTKNVPER
jgi:hypothetical protein